MRAHHTQITLNRLSNLDVRALIAQVASRSALSSESVEAVIERTGGVPLFVEELTRAVLEGGKAKLSEREIPATLHDSLMARLDRLGSAKEVMQVGAVIGSEFSYELLRVVLPLAEQELQNALRRLTDAELLYEHGIAPDATYICKHALIRDAAYDALLKSKRREYHRRIAEILQERFPQIVQVQPELLANHYTEADLVEQAIPYWQRAGQASLERSANKEAISHLTKGIELLSLMPETTQHCQQELLMQVALGTAVMVSNGFASPEAEKSWSRARKLCDQLSESPLVFQVFFGLWLFRAARAEHHQAHEAAKECLRLADSAQSSALLLEAHHAVGTSLVSLGDFVEGLRHLDHGTATYDPRKHAGQAYVYGQDSGIACLLHGAQALWYLGYPYQARRRIGEALALARTVSHPVSKAAAANIAWWVYQYLRDVHAASEQADVAVALSTEQELEFWKAVGVVGQGWALTEFGQVERGIALLRTGISAYRLTGAQIVLPYFNSLLAGAYGKARQIDEGLTMLDDAENMVAESAERWWQPELNRLRGELLLERIDSRIGKKREAEKCFRLALEIAQEQRSKSLELRATTSLARLLAKQGRRDEARAMLAEIYNWFTEGFDTADLKDAKTLLDQLSS
jgi:predicted ATPase